MKVAVFTPYGSFSRESGLVYLLANYLRGVLPQVVTLCCNGAFSVCDRDVEKNWRRDIHACFECVRDQDRLASWAGLPVLTLSNYLQSSDVERSRRWILSVPSSELKQVEVEGINLYNLCTASFRSRFGVGDPDWNNRQHEQFLRRLLLSACRACLALQHFCGTFGPTMGFMVGGNDYLSRAAVEVFCARKVNPILFKLDFGGRGIKISQPLRGTEFCCDLLLDDIYLMRADFKTWPSELLQIIDEVLGFIGLADAQLALPIAR